MIETVRNFFVIVGASTVGVVIYWLLKYLWGKLKKICIHRHSYQIHCITSTHNAERNCDEWDICLECEKCGKRKHSVFWNDRIKVTENDI